MLLLLRKYSVLLLTLFSLSLTACGYSQSDRALSGGAIGAGIGAAGSAVTGGHPVAGAIIGGTVGAVTGAATDERDVNLGRPLWRR